MTAKLAADYAVASAVQCQDCLQSICELSVAVVVLELGSLHFVLVYSELSVVAVVVEFSVLLHSPLRLGNAMVVERLAMLLDYSMMRAAAVVVAVEHWIELAEQFVVEVPELVEQSLETDERLLKMFVPAVSAVAVILAFDYAV